MVLTGIALYVTWRLWEVILICSDGPGPTAALGTNGRACALPGQANLTYWRGCGYTIAHGMLLLAAQQLVEVILKC